MAAHALPAAAQPAAPDAFAPCAACHEMTPGTNPGAPGPSLRGILGRPAGTAAFAYSQAMRDTGIVWTRTELIRFITNPTGRVPGTSMQSPPVRDPKAAEAIADYLVAVSGAPQTARGRAPRPGVFETEQASFRLTPVATGLKFPWAFDFLPEGRVIVAEKPGTIRIVDKDGRVSAPLAGGPTDVFWGGNQAGLHGLVLHPRFAHTGWVYVEYTSGSAAESRSNLVRYRLVGDRLTDPKVLFRSEPRTGNAHVGGALAFLPDGTLLLSIGLSQRGDAGAQTLNDTLGSVIRLNDDGAVPRDNPFRTRRGARPEIWTYGHRNPEGLAVRPGAAQVWETEHGPLGGDEINILKPGANYGWPLATYGRNYDGELVTADRRRTGLEGPVWYWVPSMGPGGLAFYSGDRFPEWRGDLFVASLRAMHLQRFELDGDRVIGREILLPNLEERVRDVRPGPDGYLYLITDMNPGRLLRLEPA